MQTIAVTIVNFFNAFSVKKPLKSLHFETCRYQNSILYLCSYAYELINQLNFNPTYFYEKTLPKIEFNITLMGDVCLVGASPGANCFW